MRCSLMSIFRDIYSGIQTTCYIWFKELRQVVKDEGVFMFFIVVPILYPLLYSWIYNNEAIHEVPVCVVDDSHSGLSRELIRKCDASPDVHIAFYAQDLDEAKSLVSRQLVEGIYFIPSDFETRLLRMEQATVSVYCDMSLMLAYKAVFQTLQAVTQEMGSKLKARLASSITVRDEEISALPLDYGDVALFNPQGGYGSSVLPAVLMLILQQTLVLGIGLSAGTAREANPHRNLIPVADMRYSHPLPIVLGKFMCYLMIYAVMGTWLCAAIPRMFHFPQLATWTSLLTLMTPFVSACIFFGMVMSCMVKYRENVMLLVVFISVPLLFMSGVSWPQSNIPGMWQGVSWLFPSTFGARAFVRLNTMGATVADVATELRILWMQAGAYFILAICLYRYQIYRVHRAAHERHLFLQEKYAAAKQKLIKTVRGKR